MRRLLLPGLLALAATACDDDGKPHAPTTQPQPQPDPGPQPEPPLDAATRAPVEVRHGPGPAYFGVDDVGLFRLENGTLTLLVEHAYPFHSIVVDANGVVYASAIGGIWRIEGTRKNRLEEDRGTPVDRLALGPDGVLWASDRRALHRWDGMWTTEPAATFDNVLIEDIAVDLDGRVWVATNAALWRLDGDRWSRFDATFAAGARPFFSSLEVAPDGAVYVSALHGAFVHRDGRWSDTQLSSISHGVDELAVGPAGHVVGTGGLGVLSIAAPDEPIWKTDIRDVAKARRAQVRAVDAGGRIWITTDNGLVILDGRGELVQHWLPGTVAGVDGTVTAIAVVDDGPTLPKLRPAATGTVTGRVLRRGKPVARARVELCDLTLVTFKTTPCEVSAFARTATTDASGTFRFPKIPVGNYDFAVNPDTRWRVMLTGTDCCTQLTAGGTYDVGAITID